MTYKPKQGETWDEVSYKVYGTDEFNHILLKANLTTYAIWLIFWNLSKMLLYSRDVIVREQNK